MAIWKPGNIITPEEIADFESLKAQGWSDCEARGEIWGNEWDSDEVPK